MTKKKHPQVVDSDEPPATGGADTTGHAATPTPEHRSSKQRQTENSAVGKTVSKPKLHSKAAAANAASQQAEPTQPQKTKRKSTAPAANTHAEAKQTGVARRAEGAASSELATRDPLSPDVLKANADWFDHLVELVPPRHYHDLDADRVNTKYMKKADREAAKAAFRKQHKQNKKDKLDPDKAQTSLDVQRQLAAQAADDAADAAPATLANGAAQPGLKLNLTGNVSREELQQRLATKVAAMKAARHAEEKARRIDDAKNFRASNGRQTGAKRKREPSTPAAGGAAKGKQRRLSDADFKKQLAEVDQVLSSGQKPPAKRPRPDASAIAGSLSFGKLDVSMTPSQQMGRKNKKQKKETKAELLAKVEAKQREGATAEDVSNQAKAVGEAWGAALKRARGEKVLDDPTRLRRSLKKEAKAKQKRVAAWSERTQQQKQSQATKQQKRTENLQARSQAKLDKKKAKREKKLLRPGFEGRRQGFIPAPGAAS